MKTNFFGSILLLLFVALSVSAQLRLPRESQAARLSQTVGDTTVSIAYHRPNVKSRKVWGELVPYGKVWRTGANEATLFEVSNDVTINGQTLPAGKYSLHTIPNKNEWTIIFNKASEQWGSFTYDEKQDALRVNAKPQEAEFHETMSFEIENVKPTSADVVIRWEKVAVPFTVNVGDVTGRTLAEIRRAIADAKSDDPRALQQGANWVYQSKLTNNYEEALGWTEKALAIRENYGSLMTKARLLAVLNRKPEAITVAEKAIQVGKSANPPVDTSMLEADLNGWKANK